MDYKTQTQNRHSRQYLVHLPTSFTETLLRFVLTLNDHVWSSSKRLSCDNFPNTSIGALIQGSH